MPRMSGYELTKALRRMDFEWPKILVLSGYTDYSTEEILNAGADGFFSKPFNASAVREGLQQTLLSPLERWGRQAKRAGLFRIEKHIKGLSEGWSHKEFALGRNGFFVQLKYDQPQVGEWVDFRIEIRDGHPIRTFSGQGQVMWVYSGEKQGRTPGVGVEFRYIDEFSLRQFLDWVKSVKPLSSIPIL